MTGNNRSAAAGRRQAAKQNPNPKPKRAPRRASRHLGSAVQSCGRAIPLVESNANMREMNNRTTVVSGSDFIGNVSVTKAANPGDRIRKVINVSPSAFPGTRLTQMADLWERYRFRQFRLRYVPSVPKTLACQLLLYQDTDPSDDPNIIQDADALIRQATAQTGSQQWNFHASKVIHLAKRADKELYYTGKLKENERFNLQGKAYLLQVTNPLNMNGEEWSTPGECGSLYVDWEVEFQTPQINPDATAKALDTTTTGWYKTVLQDGKTYYADTEVQYALGNMRIDYSTHAYYLQYLGKDDKAIHKIVYSDAQQVVCASGAMSAANAKAGCEFTMDYVKSAYLYTNVPLRQTP